MHAAALAALGLLGLDPEQSHTGDLALTLCVAVAFLLLRLALEAALLPPLKTALACLGRQRFGKSAAPGGFVRSDNEDDAWRAGCADVFDNAYIVVLSSLLLALGVHTVLTGNEGCVPWDTSTCLAHVPSTPLPEQRLYFLLSFHFYINELASTWLRVGTILNPVMVFHHLFTIILQALAYKMGLLTFGTMWMMLFDLSNPLLHIAKALHAVDALLLTNYKWFAFATFALAFFTCRVLCPPFAVLKPAIVALSALPPWASFFVASMVAIYLLQIHWFYKIIQMGRKGDDSKASDSCDKLQASSV